MIQSQPCRRNRAGSRAAVPTDWSIVATKRGHGVKMRSVGAAGAHVCGLITLLLGIGGCANLHARTVAERIYQARGSERFNLILTEAERGIRPGMSDIDVVRILGYPDGDGQIWVWGCDSSPPCHRPMGDWYSVLKSQRDGMALVLLFRPDIDEVMAPIERFSCRNADLWSMFQSLTGLPMDEIEKKLGVPRPSDLKSTFFMPAASDDRASNHPCSSECDYSRMPSLPRRIREARATARYDLLLSEADGYLHEGMSETEVVQRIGYPDNRDDSVVWVWMCGNEPACQRPVGDWHDLLTKAKGALRVCLFFDRDGRLITGMLKDPGDFWREYQSRTGLSKEEVESLLRHPHPASWK